MKDKEIEIQTRIQNSKDLKSFLEKEANFISENRQVDEYFTPAHKDFTSIKPIEEWFRIRDEKGRFTINYKKWIYEKGIGIYADEYETEIKDKQTARKIFIALDLKPQICGVEINTAKMVISQLGIIAITIQTPAKLFASFL